MWRPMGQAPSNDSTTWKPGPTERGSFNILSTCLVTLGLCVWTALHLNIPEHNKQSKQLWRKCLWLIIGLFAPEMIVYSALQQRIEAARLGRHMESLLQDLTAPRKTGRLRRLLLPLKKWMLRPRKRKHNWDTEARSAGTRMRKYPWTLTHSYFVIMGGFAFDTSTLEQNFLPNGRTRLTLTAHGVIKIASRYADLLPDISIYDIKDKSKASGLAKTLACLQAFWFCLMTAGRLGCAYPISALELNTLAHALCCLLTYMLWWSKPLDIDQPILVQQNKALQNLCAAMCMMHKSGVFRRLSGYSSAYAVLEYDYPSPRAGDEEQPGTSVDGMSCGLSVANPSNERCGSEITTSEIETSAKRAQSNSQGPADLGHTDPASLLIHQFEKCHGFHFRYVCGSVYIGPKSQYRIINPLLRFYMLVTTRGASEAYLVSQLSRRVVLKLGTDDVKRLQLAAQYLREDQSWPKLSFDRLGDTSKLHHHLHPDDPLLSERLGTSKWILGGPSTSEWIASYICARSPNDVLTRGDAGVETIIGLDLASGLYGAVHFIAWDGAFTSSTQLSW